MKARRSLLALWVSLALLLALIVALTAAALEPEGIITVCPPPGAGCDYTIIQEAIDNAGPGDTILVAQGAYTENLTVDKQVTLEGGYESAGWTRNITQHETILDGSNSRTVEGDWDGGRVDSPAVIRDDDTHKMWYLGIDLFGVQRIGYATSPDGLTWVKYGPNPVLDVGEGDEWDATMLEAPFVIKEGSTSYKMWYMGLDEDEVWRIGYATSPDGITWTKHPGNPVLDLGDETWNNRMVHSPSVIHEGGLYKMWLHTAGDDGGGWIPYMAYATSPDGITWTWDASNPLFSNDPAHYWEEDWIEGTHVLTEGGSYQMWYSGWGGGEASTGYATAPNETVWTKYNGGVAPVLTGTPGEWDEGRAADPFVLYTSGVYTMYYDSWISLGVATSANGIDWTKSVSNPVLNPGTTGQWGQSVVSFESGSDGSVLDGFTVRNGEAQRGGGVLVDDAQITIQNSTVMSNTAHETGGGMLVSRNSKAVVKSNYILSNTVPTEQGSGVYVDSSEVLLDSNFIAYNACTDWEHGNGAIGIGMDGPSLPVTVTNNVVVSNTDKGIMINEGVHDLKIVNNTIASNRNEGILAWGTISVTSVSNNIIVSQGYCGIAGADGADFQNVDHNNVWQNGGGDGNYCDYFDSVNPPEPGPNDISEDPLFVDAANGDYRLRLGSPCIDAGTANGAPATDTEGTPRDAAPDMGAYEWSGFGIYLPLVMRNYGGTGCVPALISPEEGAVLDNGRADGLDELVWDFDWSDCQGATQYQLYVIHPGAQNPMIDDDTIVDSSYHNACPSDCYIINENRFG